MKLFLVIASLALMVSANAVGLKRPPRMTGDQLVGELRGGPSALRYFDEHYAKGYLAGVVDVTQGHGWCLPAGETPEVADDRVLYELAKKPPGLMHGTASAVLIQYFRSSYPAPAGTCSVKPRLTGNEFAAWIVGNHQKSGPERISPSLVTLQRERFATGYVAGVVDATQGAAWCAPGRIKPDELDAVGYWGVLDKPVDALPGNAATLLHQQFIAKFPCRPHK